MKLIDKQHTLDPVRFGQLKLVEELTSILGIPINRKRVQRLMRLIVLKANIKNQELRFLLKTTKYTRIY
jgi:hypothetical protein